MKLQIKVDGKVYQVEVEVLEDEGGHRTQSPLPQSAAAIMPTAAVPAAAPVSVAADNVTADDSNCLRSPIAGVVVRLPAKLGQTVSENQELVVLEAMKMETVIASQCAGKIAKVHVNVGDSVQVRQTLVEFE